MPSSAVSTSALVPDGTEAETRPVGGLAPGSVPRLVALVEAHSALTFCALRRLGVAAEALDDATQEVFIVVSRRLAAIEEGRERSFIYATALRIAANHRRGRRNRREESLEELDLLVGTEALDVDRLLDQKRMRELLDRVLTAMPDELREVFVLFELEGLSRTELAETLSLPEGTVASRLRRAREHFEQSCATLRAQKKGCRP